MNQSQENIKIKFKEEPIQTHIASNQTTDRGSIDNQRIFTEESNEDENYNQ